MTNFFNLLIEKGEPFQELVLFYVIYICFIKGLIYVATIAQQKHQTNTSTYNLWWIKQYDKQAPYIFWGFFAFFYFFFNALKELIISIRTLS